MSPSPAPSATLVQKAEKTYALLKTAVENDSNIIRDYWKMGNALGTLLDYCFLTNQNAQRYWGELNQAMAKRLASFQGKIDDLWYDDYLWWAVGALGTPAAGGRSLEPVWAQAFTTCWNYAQRGTKVYQNAVAHWPDLEKYEPKFPGGIWNAKWTSQGPWHEANGSENCLYGIQNSVTNALRLIAASRGTFFYPKMCGDAARDECGFLRDWFNASPEPDCLLDIFSNSAGAKCALMKERARVFKTGVRDEECNYGFYWAGDQGLLVRGMIEVMNIEGASEDDKKACLELAQELIRGVKEKLVSGQQVCPWRSDNKPVPVRTCAEYQKLPKEQKPPIPFGDCADYISGTGVLLRHLWYAWKKVPDLKNEIKSAGLDTVIQAMADALPADPPPLSDGDAYLNEMTNRLAILAMAIGTQIAPAPS